MNTITINHEQYTPSKVICVGRNYHDHIQELKNEVPTSPVIFIKPNSAISDTLSVHTKDTEYECEMAFIIRDNAVAGIGIGLDMTERKIQASLQQKGLPWEMAKAFDGAAVFSPFKPLPITLDAASHGSRCSR